MAERAHPDIKGFKKHFKLVWNNGLIPKIQIYPSPYSKAFYWRYSWANNFCKGKKVLEIPCGMGWGTSILSKAKHVTGVDISLDAIKEANGRYLNSSRAFLNGNMKDLAFDNENFDVVVCLEGIEHVDIEIGKQFITEAYRVLKQNGTFLLSSPRHKTKEHSGNPYHIIEYQLNELLELIEPYFLINSIQRKKVDDLNVYFIESMKK